MKSGYQRFNKKLQPVLAIGRRSIRLNEPKAMLGAAKILNVAFKWLFLRLVPQ